MCVIIIKPAGVELPSRQELLKAWMCHPHGFGFATPTKRFRTTVFSTFYKRLQSVSVDEPCIIHLRYATHGSQKTSNCHPFKKDGIVFAHNGILSITPKGDKTDSETCFLEYLEPVAKEYGIHSDELRYAVRHVIGGSKFAFMQGDDWVTFGDFSKYEGRLYSNLRHLYYHPTGLATMLY